jgi:hypothetical protein
MGSHGPFEYLKHKLWLREWPKIKGSIWFLATKSQDSPYFTYVQVVCQILLKRFWQRLQFCFRPHLNWKSSQVMGLQSGRSPNFGTFDLGISGKITFVCNPVVNHGKYYKGEGGGFPQIQAIVSFVNWCIPVVHPCTKSVPTMH